MPTHNEFAELREAIGKATSVNGAVIMYWPDANPTHAYLFESSPGPLLNETIRLARLGLAVEDLLAGMVRDVAASIVATNGIPDDDEIADVKLACLAEIAKLAERKS